MAAHPDKGRRRRLTLPPVAPVVRFGAMAVAFLLGVAGFSQAFADAHIPMTLAQSALRAIRLIVGNFPEALEGRALPLTLQIARWALPLLTVWSTVALAWEQLRNPLRLALIRARGQHVVIAGDYGHEGGFAARAAMGELAYGRRVLLWPQDRRATWVTDALEEGAAEVEQREAGANDDDLALDKARAVLLLSRDARTNIALASAVSAQAATTRPAGDPLDVLLRVDDLDLRRSVEQRFNEGDRKTARVRLVSLPDIAARQLSLAHPIDAFGREDLRTRNILVLGFAPVIERFILRSLASGHYRDGGKPAFFVQAPGAAEIEAGFRSRHLAADAMAPISFMEARCEPALAPGLIDAFVDRHGEPVAILIDQPDDDRALALALAIDAHYRARALPAPPIHVRMDGVYDHRLGAGIFNFGDLSALAGTEMLLQDGHDALARSIHDFYLEGRFAEGDRIGARASMQEWEDLPESFRDDNRLVADCYQLKLRDIGARLIDGSGPTLLLDAAELEELSRAEHDRWMAAKLVQGWTYGPERDDARRIHPDIVPYDALTEAIKDLDREQVRIMTRLLAATGRRALRTLTLMIRPGSDEPPPAIEPMLSALADHYPDRVPLFIGDFADPAARQALTGLQATGQLIQLILSTHAQSVIDALPASEQPAATTLFRAADRVLVRSGDAEPVADLIVTTMAVDDSRAIWLNPDGSIRRAPWTR